MCALAKCMEPCILVGPCVSDGGPEVRYKKGQCVVFISAIVLYRLLLHFMSWGCQNRSGVQVHMRRAAGPHMHPAAGSLYREEQRCWKEAQGKAGF